MLQTSILVAAATGLLMVGFGANEWTHGGMAETMGFGHQHMLDNGGYHCTDMDDAAWDQHVRHMHGGWNGTGDPPYDDHCGGGHMGSGPHHGPGMGGMWS